MIKITFFSLQLINAWNVISMQDVLKEFVNAIEVTVVMDSIVNEVCHDFAYVSVQAFLSKRDVIMCLSVSWKSCYLFALHRGYQNSLFVK